MRSRRPVTDAPIAFVIAVMTFVHSHSLYLFRLVPCHSYPLYVCSVDSAPRKVGCLKSRLDHFFPKGCGRSRKNKQIF
jgi:hypothetical protein